MVHHRGRRTGRRHRRSMVGHFLVDLDDRFAADQAAHGDFVAEEPDVLEDRNDLGTADFLGQGENSPLFR